MRLRDREVESYEIINNYLSDVAQTFESFPLWHIAKVIQVLDKARESGKRVYICGNGGSAATASHFACDLAKGAICSNRPRLRVFSLTDGNPLLTAWANDTNYSNVFAEQLKNFVEPDDIVIAISGSGNSANILNAVQEANLRGAITIGFSGFDGGQLKDVVDISVNVPNHTMEQVEDLHLILAHMIAVTLRNKPDTEKQFFDESRGAQVAVEPAQVVSVM